jgi:inosine-uridine nucleoside N-ribohydrolase
MRKVIIDTGLNLYSSPSPFSFLPLLLLILLLSPFSFLLSPSLLNEMYKDVGVDDVTAILMILSPRYIKDIKVEGISLVDGNIPITQSVPTLKSVLALTGNIEIPIYCGASGPLIDFGDRIPTWAGHGSDGLGGFTQRPEWSEFRSNHCGDTDSVTVKDEIAALAFVRLVNESPKKLSFLALGPLTNLALAIKLDENFLDKIESLTIMGGSLSARGNSNRVAEYNIHADPEAAHIVFSSAAKHSLGIESPIITLITWETTVENSLEWEFYDQIKSHNTLLSRFLSGYSHLSEALGRSNVVSNLNQKKDNTHVKYTEDIQKYVLTPKSKRTNFLNLSHLDF